jgi:hypothetical protein
MNDDDEGSYTAKSIQCSETSSGRHLGTNGGNLGWHSSHEMLLAVQSVSFVVAQFHDARNQKVGVNVIAREV